MNINCPHCKSNFISLISSNHETKINICSSPTCRFYQEIVDQTLITKLSKSFELFLGQSLYKKNIQDILTGNTSFLIKSDLTNIQMNVLLNNELKLVKSA